MWMTLIMPLRRIFLLKTAWRTCYIRVGDTTSANADATARQGDQRGEAWTEKETRYCCE